MERFECRGLTRHPWFGEFDLALNAGELAVLRGPSGSGKTLLLRALADLDPRDAGELLLDGQTADTQPAHQWRRRVRYVHQQAPLLRGSVAQHLLALKELGSVRAAPLDVPAGIDPETEARRLSGGEAQRLALHVALASGPEVLLLDEPTSALDAERAQIAEREVRDYVASGHCALWVSHDSNLAQRLGAREVAFP